MAELIKTPHPVTLEGQERIAVELRPGESLFSLLNRTLQDQLDGELWNVVVAGVEIPRERWHDCYPKDGQLIEVTGDLGRSALMMVAVIALTIWTGGAFAAVAAGGSIAGMGAVASYAVIAGIQVAGSLLINKVLGPKPPGSPDTSQGPAAYSLNSTSNQMRQHGAVGILFGRQRFAPDLLGKPYTYFDSDDMFMAMHLAWGIGVGRVANLRNGDTLLSDFDDAVTVWNAGFSEMPDQVVPLFGNVDTQPGGSLQQEKEPVEVVRTTAVETVRVQANISGSLYGITRKGKLSENQETFQMDYRRVGVSGWTVGLVRPMRNDDRRTLRFTMTLDLPIGQYDIRIRRLGQQSTGDGDVCEFSFDTLASIQEDHSTYDGIARTGLTLRANDRLSGQPTEVNGDAVGIPLPVWTEAGWITQETSNPGAQMLQYLRGFYSPTGLLVAGMGLDDSEIDIEGFKAFMLHCADQNLEYNFWLAKERDHLEVLNSIAGAAMAQFTDANGLHSVVWVAEQQPVDGTINMARVKKGTFRVDYSLIGTADGVVARYWDATQNAEAILRVPMPGVTTMLSPAQLTLEGVTNEAQAALLARYYLAQSLYQFKDVSFGVSLENLTFRRLSLLQVQHDLTQWGFGGVVVRTDVVDNRVRLFLDEPVPAPAPGRECYIGVRVPGQRAAAVFRVKPFTGTAQAVTLDEAWPSDLPLPGDSTDNPAHDSIWIYDFKETPGLTARVTSIARAADRSATVSVVQESQEFWTYVKTGAYLPADSGSLLTTRPTASAITVAEQADVTGDVIQDQLVVSFQISGPYGSSRVYTTEVDGTLRLRAETDSRSAVFNIPGPGTYTITVVPYSRQGLRGTPVSATYSTVDSGLPPRAFDYFNLEQAPGGIRRYVWGYNPETLQPANLAGAEIRYTAGEQASPDWDTMQTLGDLDGFFTSAAESLLPEAGVWTFAVRARNTNGQVGPARLLVATLGNNLSQVIGGIEQDTTGLRQDITKEINDRINADLQVAQDAADALDAAADALQGGIDRNAAGLVQEALDRVAGDLNTEVTLTTKITQETLQRETDVENLTRMISSISAGSGEQFDFAEIWHFNSSTDGWAGTANDGWLHMDGLTTTSPSGLDIDGAMYRNLKARVRRTGVPGALELVYVQSDGGTGRMVIPQPTWGDDNVGVMDLQDIPWQGEISQIVLIAEGATETVFYEFDWIAVGRPSPGASVAMVQEESRARIAEDAINAQRTTSLGVQLRGDYTGSDVAGVQQGLIASEKNARIDGDGVNATAIEALRSRMPAGNGSVASQAEVTQLSQTNAAEHQAIGLRIDTLSANLDGKADATAVDQLRTEVNDINGRVTANSQSILSLGSRVGSAEQGIAGNATAISGLTTTVNQQGSDITAQAQQLAQLNGRVVNTEQGVAANTGAITGLTTTVTNLGNQVAATSQQATRVEAALYNNAPNMLVNPSFAAQPNPYLAWDLRSPGTVATVTPQDGPFAFIEPVAGGMARSWVQDVNLTLTSGITASADIFRNGAEGTVYVGCTLYDAAGNIVASATALSPASESGRWVRHSVTLPFSPGVVRARFAFVASGVTQNTSVRRCKLEVGNIASAYSDDTTPIAQATAINTMSATVTQHGQQITAQAQQIQSVQADLGSKAEASVVQSMQVQVRNQGAGTNLLENATFPNWQATGWVPVNSFGPYRNTLGSSYLPAGVTSAAAGYRPGAFPAGETQAGWDGRVIAVESGKTYCVSAYFNLFRCQARVVLEWYNAAGGQIAGLPTPYASGGYTGGGIEQYPRVFAIGVAPAGAVSARFTLQIYGVGASEPYFWMFRPMFAQVADGATAPPIWNAGGAEANAQWQVNVRADGKVGGLRLASTGQESVFDVVADRFTVSSPGGGERTEYSNGNWRVYDPNGVLRVRFGVFD